MTKAMTPERARRRAVVRLYQKIQHAVPGFVLLGEGAANLHYGVDRWHVVLSIAEIVTCVAVFVSLVFAVRELRRHQKAGTVPHIHLGIDWIDIFLGAMFFTEAWAKYLDNGHIQRPTILMGLVMVFFGLFGGRFIAWKHRGDA